MTEYRAHFDAEIDFVNGGGLRAEAFRLDLPSADLTEAQIGELLVRHLGLALVGASRCRTSRSSRRRTAGRAASAMRRRMPRRHPPGSAPRRARAASSSTSATRSAPGS